MATKRASIGGGIGRSCGVAALLFWTSAALAAPTAVHIADSVAPPGATVVAPVSHHGGSDGAASTLVLHLSLPWAAASAEILAASEALLDAGKVVDVEMKEDGLSIAVFGGTDPVPEGELFQLLMTLQGDASWESTSISDQGSHGAAADATAIPIVLVGGAVTPRTDVQPHSADMDGDWRLSLPELLRVIQLYSADEYHCSEDGPDGFAPGAGPRDCTPHSADYQPADWRVSFYELLRVIQLYNSPYGAYSVREDSEDGYAPGPYVMEGDAGR